MSSPANNVVTNIDTNDWAPSQVCRWLQEMIDDGSVGRVLVVIEKPEDTTDDCCYMNMWSKSQRRDLWYMMSWAMNKFQEKYFLGFRDD